MEIVIKNICQKRFNRKKLTHSTNAIRSEKDEFLTFDQNDSSLSCFGDQLYLVGAGVVFLHFIFIQIFAAFYSFKKSFMAWSFVRNIWIKVNKSSDI